MPSTPEEERQDPGRDGPRRAELPESVIEDVFAAPRRALMLSILAERKRPVALDDLVRATLAREEGVPPASISREACTEARTEAYERHLPKLTAIDAVEYDSLLGTVELTDDRIAARVAQID